MAKKASSGKVPAKRGSQGKIPEVEYQRRVDECKLYLERHFTKGEIKKVLCPKYNISARTVEDYLSRARELIVLEVKEARDVFRGQSLAFYRSVLKDGSVPVKDRIMAQRQIDSLLGLHAPWKVAQTDTNGKDISPDEARARVSDLARQLADRIRTGGPGGVDPQA